MLDRDSGLSMTLLSIPKLCYRFVRGVGNIFFSSFKHDRSVVKEEWRWVSSISSVPYSFSLYRLNTLKPSDVLQQVGSSVELILRLLTTLRTRVTASLYIGTSDTYLSIVRQYMKNYHLCCRPGLKIHLAPFYL